MLHHIRSGDGWRFALAVTVSLFAGAGCGAQPSDVGRAQAAQTSAEAGGFALSSDGAALKAFGIDADGNIVENISNGIGAPWAATWTLLPPAPAGVGFTGLIASISWSAGRTDVFVADGGTTIWHAFQNPNTPFYGWEPIGNVPNVRKLVVTSAGPGNLDIFAMYLTDADTDGTPRHITQIKYRNGFQPAVDVPLQHGGNQVVDDFSAASWGFGSSPGLPRIDLAVLDHGGVEHYWTNEGDYWLGYEDLGYIPAGSIAMSSFGPGNLDIAVLSNINANHDTYMHYAGWSGFTQQMQPLPTPAPPQHSDVVDELYMGFAAAAARGGRTDIVVGLEMSDLSFSPWQAWYTGDGVLNGGQFF